MLDPEVWSVQTARKFYEIAERIGIENREALKDELRKMLRDRAMERSGMTYVAPHALTAIESAIARVMGILENGVRS